MSIEKQKLYNEIETLSEELTNHDINLIKHLKSSYADTKSDNSITIKNKRDLKNKLQKGFNDINANKNIHLMIYLKV